MGPFFGALLSIVVAADAQLTPGTQLHYRGTVAEMKSDRSAMDASKSFELMLLVERADADGAEFYWLLDENGAGAFGWPDRVGRWTQTADGSSAATGGPALLYDYGKGKHVVPLQSPTLPHPAGLEPGKQWERDGLEFQVARSTVAVERPAWQIDVRNQFGPQRRVWIDKDSDLVLQSEDRVFMNQGTEYRAAVQLQNLSQPADAERAKLRAAFAAMFHLKDKVKRTPRTVDDAWTPPQLKALGEHLAGAKSPTAATPLERLIAAAERDLRRVTDRTQALDAIVGKQVGRKVESFKATGLDEARLADADLVGGVSVLHFWDYRDQPLKEPYGQVGYLEFLYARHQAAGLKVYGVAVDGRFDRPAEAKAAASGVRKLKSFMNLSYPIVFDGGALIRQFDDPRLVGGELPLFVVVDRAGKIVHYKVGHYTVDREAGLKELDAVVRAQLSTPKSE